MTEQNVDEKRVRISREDFFNAVVNAVKNNMTRSELAESLGVKEGTVNQRLIKMNEDLKKENLETYKLPTKRKATVSYAEIAKQKKLEIVKTL